MTERERLLKPLSADDCVNVVNKYGSEIQEGKYIIQLEEEWIERLPEAVWVFR